MSVREFFAIAPPHLLMEPGLVPFLEKKGVVVPENARRTVLPPGHFPDGGKVSPVLLNDPVLRQFLKQRGVDGPL